MHTGGGSSSRAALALTLQPQKKKPGPGREPGGPGPPQRQVGGGRAGPCEDFPQPSRRAHPPPVTQPGMWENWLPAPGPQLTCSPEGGDRGHREQEKGQGRGAERGTSGWLPPPLLPPPQPAAATWEGGGGGLALEPGPGRAGQKVLEQGSELQRAGAAPSWGGGRRALRPALCDRSAASSAEVLTGGDARAGFLRREP